MTSTRSKALSEADMDRLPINTERLIEIYRKMVLIRFFEEKVGNLVQSKEIITPCHLYIGQEAIAAGACAVLRKTDTIWSTHRSHGHYLGKGGDPNAAMAEIFCRQGGCSGGRGGSMHLCSPDIGLFGSSSIVAGSVPLGVGFALAENLKGSDNVSVIFHGDGAPEEGVFHEVANFASLHKLPAIFICEHNQYCTHLHMNKRRPKDNLSEIFKAYDMETRIVDGNDVIQVYSVVSEAVSACREGSGPWFIECHTYRWRGHVGPNWDVDLGLRSQEEIDCWIERCPVKHLESLLLTRNLLDEQDIETIRFQTMNEVHEAVEYARTCPLPEPEHINLNVFAEKE